MRDYNASIDDMESEDLEDRFERLMAEADGEIEGLTMDEIADLIDSRRHKEYLSEMVSASYHL